MISLIPAALASATIAAFDYTIVPVLVTVAVRLGLITPPASLSWVGSAEAIGGAATVYALGLISSRRGRPPLLKFLERSLGIPFMALSLAAVGMGAAQAVLGGYLPGPESMPSAWPNIRGFTSSEIAALVGVGVVALPFAIVGKAIRSISRHLPFARGIQTTLAAFALGSSALISQLPIQLQVGIILAAVAMATLLGVGILRRAHSLLGWWRGEDAPASQRMAVLAELLLPGSGGFLLGRPRDGLPRLALAVPMLLSFLLVGPLAVPIYLFVSLGSAIKVARSMSGMEQAHPGTGPIEAQWRVREERGKAMALASGRTNVDDDW